MSTWKLIEEDFDRHSHAKGIVRYIRMLIALLGNPSFMTTFWFRLASSTSPPPIVFLCNIVYRFISIVIGIQILPHTQIGSGLRFPHHGTIVINHCSVIGKNCTIMQGVTIGKNTKGSPVIGDNVFIGANALVIGKVVVGNNVCIGAGSVVVKDVPDNAVVVGNPAKIISYDGEILGKGY